MSTNRIQKGAGCQRSGKVNWGRFIPFTIAAFALVVFMAYVLRLLFPHGFYHSVIGPLAVTPFLFAAAYLAARLGECRNLAVMIATSAAVSLVLFLSYFLSDFVLTAVANEAGLKGFDEFLVDRLMADAPRTRAGDVNRGMMWIMLGIQTLCPAFIVTIAVSFLLPSYCEDCGRWKRVATVAANPKNGVKLRNALLAGRLDKLPPVGQEESPLFSQKSTIQLEYCPDWELGWCPTYLSIDDPSWGGELLKQVEISPQEVRLLEESIPRLRLSRPKTSEPAGVSKLKKFDSLQRSCKGMVQTINDNESQSIYTVRNDIIALCLSLTPIGTFLGGVGLAAWGLWHTVWNSLSGPAISGWGIIGLGSCLATWGGWICWLNVDFFNNLYCHHRIRRLIVKRPAALVKPDDPDAMFVEVVPRENWTGLICDLPSDGGFLRVDESSGEVLFEGVKARYRISGRLISACRVEAINPDAGRAAMYVTIVQTPAFSKEQPTDDAPPDPLWEAAFMVRVVTLVKNRKALRRRLAEKLRRRVWTILDNRAQINIRDHQSARTPQSRL